MLDNVPPIPTCVLMGPVGTRSGDILVGVTPNSLSSATVDLRLEYSRNLGLTYFLCTMAPGSPRPNPALGAPISVPTSFLWDSFADGVGMFEGADTHQGRPVRVRFIWSQTDAPEPRWEQAFSADGGQNWETNWVMELSPAGDER